jgi:hypothetical protein
MSMSHSPPPHLFSVLPGRDPSRSQYICRGPHRCLLRTAHRTSHNVAPPDTSCPMARHHTSGKHRIEQVRPTINLCHRMLTTILISHAHFPPSSTSARPLPLCIAILFLWALLWSAKTHLSDVYTTIAQFCSTPHSMLQCASKCSKQPSCLMHAKSQGLAVLGVDECHTKRLDYSTRLIPRHWCVVSYY